MKILTVNSGSSSVRLAAFVAVPGRGLELIAKAHQERAATASDDFLAHFIKHNGLDDVSVIAHRVVHGGALLVATQVVDEALEQEIERLEVLAPLHNKEALNWIRMCRATFRPNTLQMAAFDTAFYANLPEVARTYALPRKLVGKYDLRRYGFHGLAHRAMWRRWSQLRPDLSRGGRVISLQLGAGCSVTAIDGGEPRDTSMGFSPLEGLVMATRCGDIDPGLITFLQRSEALTPDATDDLLYKQSGLLGLSEISGDMRRLLDDNSPGARLAIDIFCYRARQYLGAYLAVLNGVDGIVFGGGIGENAPLVRERILAGMEWCGVRLNNAANHDAADGERCISHEQSTVDVRVLLVDEAGELARDAHELITRR
ncbi:MAG: acetate/propionate family kinase [Acidiferrobacterales bacterium]